MTEVLPLRYEGNGVFRCLHPTRIKMDDGEVHGWQMAEHRSPETHRHYFACIRNAWANLSEDKAERFKSPEHLRHHALVMTGFGRVSEMVFRSNAEAIKAALLMSEMDTYAVVNIGGIDGNVVTVGRADSQSMRAMGKERFAASKEAVLNFISTLLGTDVTELEEAA